jgi:hypothetical protein
MKKMNNYEAPKAEVIELSVNKAFMQGMGGTTTLPDSASAFGS